VVSIYGHIKSEVWSVNPSKRFSRINNTITYRDGNGENEEQHAGFRPEKPCSNSSSPFDLQPQLPSIRGFHLLHTKFNGIVYTSTMKDDYSSSPTSRNTRSHAASRAEPVQVYGSLGS